MAAEQIGQAVTGAVGGSDEEDRPVMGLRGRRCLGVAGVWPHGGPSVQGRRRPPGDF
jgi:hypothetical protein